MRNRLPFLTLTLLALLSGCASTKLPVAVALPCPEKVQPPPALMLPPESPTALATLSKALPKPLVTMRISW